jgi:hypothetical protein
MMRNDARWLAVMALTLLCGCAESVSIRSGPSGAKVFVDNQPAGTTPMHYELPRSALDEPHTVMVEKDGYQPASATMKTRLAKGRVTGAFFTLGILALFRSMYYVEPVFFALEPVAPPQHDRDRALGEALRNLNELHQRGVISDEELQRRTRELLRQP